MTNNLERRVYEHKQKLIKGFTEKYNLNKLVYYEETDDVVSAIEREKEIKIHILDTGFPDPAPAGILQGRGFFSKIPILATKIQ